MIHRYIYTIFLSYIVLLDLSKMVYVPYGHYFIIIIQIYFLDYSAKIHNFLRCYPVYTFESIQLTNIKILINHHKKIDSKLDRKIDRYLET